VTQSSSPVVHGIAGAKALPVFGGTDLKPAAKRTPKRIRALKAATLRDFADRVAGAFEVAARRIDARVVQECDEADAAFLGEDAGQIARTHFEAARKRRGRVIQMKVVEQLLLN
jgi:hypothetical protein